MICVHCGKEIDNGQAFCPYCGSRVGGDAAPEAKAAKKDPRKLALPVAAVALLAVVGVGLANRMPSIDLQRYVTITAQGYDTLGKLDVSFDTDKLEADYGKRIADSFKKAMNDHKESTYGLSSLAADLYSGSETELFVDYCATGSADKTSGLRNGDVVTYSWNESEDEAETLFGVKVKYSDITYTVSGLEKVNTFDAFDGVTVEFNGTAPQGTATVNSLPTAEAGGSLHYTLDTTDGLRNGDTVTLTASSNREDFSDCIEKYGADTLSDCYKYGVGVPQSFHQAALWEQYAINLYYIYRDYYNKSDDESYRDSRLDEIGRLSVSCHIQRNLPDALYTDEQWGCISDFGCMPTELVALSRAEKPDTPYISHTSSLVMQMIQKTSLEELKQMGHTYLNYVRRNSSKNPLEDWKQAVNYYYAGAAQGDAECAAAVGYCCEMDPRGSNLPLALAWYQHAAKAGSAWAMEKVATFYEEGYGCTANRALADACRETLKYMR